MKEKSLVGYIRQDDSSYIKLRDKVKRLCEKILIIVKVEEVKNGFKISIPKYRKYNLYIQKKIKKKIRLILQKNKIDYLAVEESLDWLNSDFKEEIVLNGKYIMKNLLPDVLKYVFYINNKNMNLENLYIFVNKYTKNNIYIIKKLVTIFKTVNIITENMKYYRRLENELYKEGILITVSNNKRKSVKNAKYIVNFDFEKDRIEQYNFNLDSIVINLTNEKNILKKKTGGVLINNIELNIDKNYRHYINEFYGKINSKIFVESMLIGEKEDHSKVEKIIDEYNLKIVGVKGVRGIIQKKEIFNVCK
ncbi:MAG: hypothetical protein IJ690_00825 [Clostridia bacterium]|nr:hypothetical protein [Clostridia bacterium]